MTKARASRLWLLLPALFALGWFLPVLQHGFRSDDFLTVYYFDRDAEVVRWGRVFEEWVRPWFGVRDLYRPFVSLTFGVNWALSTSPFGFHLLNVLVLGGTAVCVAATAMRLARGRAALVGVAAGLLVVLHPAAVEPAAWISARTSGLQVCFSALAYWSFVRWRDGDGRVWLPCVAVLLACASKEGAVLLPASLIVLDLVRGRWPTWRVHLPFFVIVGGYLLYRWLLLGVFTTAEEGHTLGERLGNAMTLFGQLIVPPLGLGIWLWLGLGLLAIGSRRSWWCLPWAALLLLPGTTHVVLNDGELAGRFVFDAVPALALFVALALDGMPSSWSGRLGPTLGALMLFVGSGISSQEWLARYDDEAAQIDAAQRELLRHAAAGKPGEPFGVVGLPGLPLLQPQLWGFLTQRPFAERDLPVVGLSNILTKDPAAPYVFTDTTAIHALVADGAGCAVWDEKSRTLKPVAKAEPGMIEFVQDPNDPRRFVPPRLLPPTAVAMLEITSTVAVEEWRAEILGNLEGDYAARPLVEVPEEGRRRAWIDTAHVLPWMVAATFGGGPAGILLTGDGKPPPAGTTVTAHTEPPRYPVPTPPSEVLDRRELASVIVRPNDRYWYNLYLLLPTGLFSVELPARYAVAIEPAVMAQIDFACDVLGSCRVHWFLADHLGSNGGPGDPPRRSAFGTCTLR